MTLTIELYDESCIEALMQASIDTGENPETILNAALTMYLDIAGFLDSFGENHE